MKRGGSFTTPMRALAFLLAICAWSSGSARADAAKDAEDLAKRFTRTAEMVAMRDGVKLYTTVFAPKDAKGPQPIVLLRTPYGIEARGPEALNAYLKDLADDGYILAFQDIRGRHKSEGQFVMLRPPRDRSDAR